MAQHDFNVADGSGAVVRSDVNGAFEALATNSMGPSAPSPTWPLMWWGDTTAGRLKQRNSANTAWIDRCDLLSPFLQLSSGAYPSGSGENIDLSDNPDLNGLAGYPPGFVYNATVSINTTDSSHDLDIGKFSVRDDGNAANVDASAALTKQMDAAFAEGSNAGGMASGQVLPASGFFYVFAVVKDSDGTVDVMGDVDSEGANVNSGWSVSRLLARVSTDASSNIQKVVNFWDLAGDWVFESDELSIVQSGETTVSHLLDATNLVAKLLLVCKTSEFGYSPGDIVDLSAFTSTQSVGGSVGAAMVIDSENILVVFGSYISGVFGVPHKATNGLGFITAANWRVILRAKS